MQPISSSSPTAISFQTYEKVKIGCALEFFFPCSTVSKHTEVFIQYRFFPTCRSVWPKERLPSRSSYQSKILNCSKYNSQQQQDSKSHKIYLIWYILKKKMSLWPLNTEKATLQNQWFCFFNLFIRQSDFIRLHTWVAVVSLQPFWICAA